jgi:hypothetical protein
MSGSTRAEFLGRGAKGGIGLVAGGSVLALAQGTAFGASSADADIAKLAATASSSPSTSTRRRSRRRS